MIFSGKCPKCGCTTIGGPFRVHGGDRHVKLDLPGMSTATVDAFTCCDCGYTEFHADRMGVRNVRNSGRFLKVERAPREYERKLSCKNCGRELASDDKFCPECGIAV